VLDTLPARAPPNIWCRSVFVGHRVKGTDAPQAAERIGGRGAVTSAPVQKRTYFRGTTNEDSVFSGEIFELCRDSSGEGLIQAIGGGERGEGEDGSTIIAVCGRSFIGIGRYVGVGVPHPQRSDSARVGPHFAQSGSDPSQRRLHGIFRSLQPSSAAIGGQSRRR